MVGDFGLEHEGTKSGVGTVKKNVWGYLTTCLIYFRNK